MKVKLADVTLDKDIYPRQHESARTVASYVEALKGGARFPPIEVQEVIVEEYGRQTERLICLDGWHRVLAYREYNRRITEGKLSEIEATCWRDEPLDKEEHLEELRIRSAQLNVRHGDRLSPTALQYQLLRIVRGMPVERVKRGSGVVAELAQTLGYHPSYVSKLVGEELRARRAKRDAEIYRLVLLGWTREEIGEKFGLAQETVRDIGGELTSQFTTIQEQFERGKSVAETAEYYGLDDITTWAIVLQGKSDEQRFKLFGSGEYQNDSPRLYNVWNFTRRDQRLGARHPGNIPGQIAMSVLYYYTQQGDSVADPMAGGGSTIDACLVMGRECRAYDLAATRMDIVAYDLWEGFPETCKGCDLIFLDPPYWRLQRGFYAEESVSEAGLEAWREFMKKVALASCQTVKVGGHVALVIEAFFDEKVTGKFLDLPFECWGYFSKAGFVEVQRISIPMPSEIKSVQDVEYAKKKKIMLDLNRDLLIFRKKA